MPDTEAEKQAFREKLRSLQFNGQGMRVPRTAIVDGQKRVEDIGPDGTTAGFHSHHKSGRVDATAIMSTPAQVFTESEPN